MNYKLFSSWGLKNDFRYCHLCGVYHILSQILSPVYGNPLKRENTRYSRPKIPQDSPISTTFEGCWKHMCHMYFIGKVNANPFWWYPDNTEVPPTHLSITHCTKTRVYTSAVICGFKRNNCLIENQIHMHKTSLVYSTDYVKQDK